MPLFYLVLLLTAVPALELVILLQVHHAIATAWGSGPALLITLGTIIFTGVAGAALARQQGLSVLRGVQEQMRQGQPPGRALIDGVLILIGAALLLTPGFLTDILGFSLLIPVTRTLHRQWLRRWIEKKIHRGDVQTTFVTPRTPWDDVDDEARRVDQ